MEGCLKSNGWAIGASIAGVTLAFLVIQRPDTGDEVNIPAPYITSSDTPDEPTEAIAEPTEDEASTPAQPAPSIADAPNNLVRPGSIAAPPIERGDEIPGPNPLAAEAQERRAQPESVQSGKASIPWTLIRRNLNRTETEQAKELSDLSNQLVLDLRRMRRDPDTFDYGELEQRQRDLAEQIRGSGLNSDPEIDQMLVRVEEILTEYDQLKAAK
jgi:hypothetical protein